MTREELIAYDRWLTENKWGGSEIITPEQAADLYLTEHPLPPAEGAEQRIRVRNILQDFYRRGEYELEQAEEDILRLFQPQPTAEGAEEILTEEQFTAIIKATCEDVWYGRRSLDPVKEQTELIVKKVYPLLTLHAQRIAEKMVSERLREELIRYIKWYGGFNYEDMTDEMLVNEYLKTRDSHESV